MKKFIKWTLSIILLVFIILTSLGFVEYKKAISEISLKDKVAEIQARDDYVEIEDISDYVLKATVSTEDQRFYSHSGVDFIAYGRIAYVLLTTGELSGGGSTITQQLAKNLYFGYEPSIIRKFAEFFMVHDIESQYDKDTILEIYLNIINYGDNHMGIYQASEGYFGKEPKDLTFNEATLVVGIPQSPSNYQLSDHAENAYKRQQAVIQTLIDTQTFSEDEIQELMDSE